MLYYVHCGEDLTDHTGVPAYIVGTPFLYLPKLTNRSEKCYTKKV